MQKLVDEPALARGSAPAATSSRRAATSWTSKEHVSDVEALYARVIRDKTRLGGAARSRDPGGSRFDTNPDDCNLRCIMCEEHSPHSRDKQSARRPPESRDGACRIEMRAPGVLEDSPRHALREIIPSTMGEPLIYDHFDEIIDLCMDARAADEPDHERHLSPDGARGSGPSGWCPSCRT